MHAWIKWLCGVSIIGVMMMIWAVCIEPARVIYPEQDIELKMWPSALAGYKVVFITDLHVGSLHITLEKVQEIVRKVNDLKPDLVLLGGDFVIQGVVGGNVVPSSKIAEVLAQLRARHGVFGVLGNHDWWENAVRIKAEFERLGVPMLEDESRYIGSAQEGFWLVGVSDYYEGAHDMKMAMTGVNSDAPVMLLTHTPDIFPEISERVALTLCGHTHGGQVYLPLVGRPVVPSKYGQRYAMGLVREGEKQLFVSAGIGTSIIPVRFMTPPEVNILRIYPSKK